MEAVEYNFKAEVMPVWTTAEAALAHLAWLAKDPEARVGLTQEQLDNERVSVFHEEGAFQIRMTEEAWNDIQATVGRGASSFDFEDDLSSTQGQIVGHARISECLSIRALVAPANRHFVTYTINRRDMRVSDYKASDALKGLRVSANSNTTMGYLRKVAKSECSHENARLFLPPHVQDLLRKYEMRPMLQYQCCDDCGSPRVGIQIAPLDTLTRDEMRQLMALAAYIDPAAKISDLQRDPAQLIEHLGISSGSFDEARVVLTNDAPEPADLDIDPDLDFQL